MATTKTHRDTVVTALSGIGIEQELLEFLVDRCLEEEPGATPAIVRKKIEAAIADSPQAREAALLEAEKTKRGKK